MSTHQAVEGFARISYPRQLRILPGIAKPLGAIAFLIPGWPRLKQWADAGFTFAWIAAVPARYLVQETASALTALVLLVILIVSYFSLALKVAQYRHEHCVCISRFTA